MIHKRYTLEAMLALGTLIGSRKWGGYKPDSDYDIACTTETAGRITLSEDFTLEDEYTQAPLRNLSSLKFINCQGYKINLITWPDNLLPLVSSLNEVVDNLPSSVTSLMASDKAYRHRLIELLVQGIFSKVITIT